MEDKITNGVCSLYWMMMNALTDIVGGIGSIFDASGDYGVMSTAEKEVQGIVADGMNMMQGIGLALALLFFLIALLELTTSERLTLEFFVKFFGKLAISVALIIYAPEIVKWIGQFASAFTSMIAGWHIEKSFNSTLEASYGGAVKKFFEAECAGLGWIMMILEAALVALVLLILALVLYMVAYVLALSRVIEMTVRGIFIPIAFGLISDDGWRGAGGRYIKKYVAVCCQGAMLTLIAKAMTMLINTTVTACFQKMINHPGTGATSLTTPFGIALFVTGICVAGISVMFKSIGLINDVFGV